MSKRRLHTAQTTPHTHTHTHTRAHYPGVHGYEYSYVLLLPAPPVPGTIVSAVLHRAVVGDEGRRTLALTKPITYTVHYTLMVGVTRHLGKRDEREGETRRREEERREENMSCTVRV